MIHETFVESVIEITEIIELRSETAIGQVKYGALYYRTG